MNGHLAPCARAWATVRSNASTGLRGRRGDRICDSHITLRGSHVRAPPCTAYDAFLEASFCTTSVFAALGSVVSSVAKDINANANKLKRAVEAAKAAAEAASGAVAAAAELTASRTLEHLVRDEVSAAGSAKLAATEASATLALLWLARCALPALDYTFRRPRRSILHVSRSVQPLTHRARAIADLRLV